MIYYHNYVLAFSYDIPEINLIIRCFVNWAPKLLAFDDLLISNWLLLFIYVTVCRLYQMSLYTWGLQTGIMKLS